MRLRRAFSLIEVLLVMGIIAVVTAMGFSISKTGMEKAYNQYWYTGYEALWNVTTDANVKGKFDPENPNLEDYAMHLAEMVNAPDPTNCSTGALLNGLGGVQNLNCRSVTAPNGIVYAIRDVIEPGHAFEGPFMYAIDMTIPALRQRRNFANQTRFAYVFRNVGNVTFPMTDGMLYPTAYANNGYISLQDRADLLTYYLADSVPNSNSNRTFYNFREAFCRTYGEYSYTTISNPSIDITCGSILQDHAGSSIVPINPRKAF